MGEVADLSRGVARPRQAAEYRRRHGRSEAHPHRFTDGPAQPEATRTIQTQQLQCLPDVAQVFGPRVVPVQRRHPTRQHQLLDDTVGHILGEKAHVDYVAGSIEDFASGSGCTPGTTELPDGEWFGYVGDVTATDLTFDLACWFTGPAAEQAAAEDGQESPPPNDYYVRNVNTTVRTAPAAAGAEVKWLPNTGDPTTATTVDYVTWLAERESRDFQPGVWLTVADGMVTFVEEQYVP